MIQKTLIGAMIVFSLIQAFLPDMIPSDIVPLLLVLVGFMYGAIATDAEDPTSYLIVVLAIGAASHADVLNSIHGIGIGLDAIFDALMYALYASTVTVVVIRASNRLKA